MTGTMTESVTPSLTVETVPPGKGERLRVVVTDGVSSSGLAALNEDPRFHVQDVTNASTDERDAALATAHALIVRSKTKVGPDVLALAPQLRVIGRAGVGVDNIDLVASTERGIPVLNAPAGNTVSAAELTMALILAAARRVPAADRSVRAGEWARARFSGQELRSKTLGLVGAGRIGGEVARRAQAFGMNVLCYDPYLTEERAEDLRVRPAALEDVLESADVLSLHVPLTSSTEGMIGGEQLARMKPTAILVNVARGGIVDEEALAQALEAGKLAGAALDVYTTEPLAEDSPLRSAPNVVLTPHLGASTAEAQELVAVEIAGAVRAALLEGDLSRAVNAPAIGGETLQRLRPMLELGRVLGAMACRLCPGAGRSLRMQYAGSVDDVLRTLSQAVLAGLLRDVVGRDRVNFVNSAVMAEARGMHVTRATSSRRPDFAEYLEVVLDSAEGSVRIAGALLGGMHPRIVRIDDYRVDVRPHGTMVILRNQDVPGVIGRVGTLLGSQGLNIAEYHQSRLSVGGPALAAICVDGAVDRETLEALLEIAEVTDARAVDLE
jgi:D-3-phosphoglycerate dehydrogenase